MVLHTKPTQKTPNVRPHKTNSRKSKYSTK